MSIKGLKLNDFTVFEKAEFKFSSGLNIILGENSTGKTHLMKLMYGIIRENDKRSTLSEVFKVDAGELDTLVRNQSKGPAEIKLELSGGFFEHSIQITDSISVDRLLPVKPSKGIIPQTLFIPAVEKLSSYEGFMASYQMRELSYDVTHYDICMALSAGILKGEKADAAVKLLQPLTEAWGGTVTLENGRFYVALKDDEKYQVHQLSEGYRKLGSIVRLVNNGAIEKGSVLFWDEPTASLNSNLVEPLVKLLLGFAASGVQVFITTQDHLLSNELSMAVDYKKEESKCAEMKFFSLYREESNGPVLCDIGYRGKPGKLKQTQ